jgi:hypothetical protein
MMVAESVPMATSNNVQATIARPSEHVEPVLHVSIQLTVRNAVNLGKLLESV